jgi:hypothetical protein
LSSFAAGGGPAFVFAVAFVVARPFFVIRNAAKESALALAVARPLHLGITDRVPHPSRFCEGWETNPHPAKTSFQLSPS